MLYAAQAHAPTAQLGAVACRLFSPTADTLVLNKLDRLDCCALSPDGTALEPLLSVPVNGTIAAVEPIHPPHHGRASLVVLTTSLRLFVLAAPDPGPDCIQSYTLETVSSISVEEPFGRLAEYQAVLVDPEARCIAVHAYAGLLRVVSLVESTRRSSTSGGGAGRARAATRGDAMDEGEDDGEGEGAGGGGNGSAPPARTLRQGTIDLAQNFSLRLSSLLNVTALSFLPSAPASTGSEPTLACIHADHSGSRVLTSLEIDLDEKDLRNGPVEPQTLADQGSEVLIPVPAPRRAGQSDAKSSIDQRGLLVVGENSVTFLPVPETAAAPAAAPASGGKGKRRASSSAGLPPKTAARGVSRALPVSRITAWTYLSPGQVLLGDIYGKLLLLSLQKSSGMESVEMAVRDLGDATSPTAMVALPTTPDPSAEGSAAARSSHLVYLSSRFGDSQLVRLEDVAPAGSPDLQLVASYSSLAPIIDCCLVKDETGSSNCLVACSGAYKTGSLRVVRRGVSLSELAAVELPGVQKLWSFPGPDGSSYLVLGSFAETRVLQVHLPSDSSVAAGSDEAEVEIEEVSLAPFADSAAGAAATTLFAGRVGEVIVHARPEGVGYASLDEEVARTWSPAEGRKVTAAAAVVPGPGRASGGQDDGPKSEMLLVAVEGGRLELLEVQGSELVSVGSTKFAHDIACLTATRIGDRCIGAVGLWTSQEVHLLEFPSLEIRATQVVDSTYLVCSLAVGLPSTSMEDRSRTAMSLLVGLGDGTLTTYEFDAESLAVRARSARSTVLGRKPLALTGLGGSEGGILALSERPTAVTKAKGRFTYSGVNLTGVTAVAELVAEGAAAATASRPVLAVATTEGISLGQLDTIQQIDVKTVPLDEDEPRRIAYDEKRQLLGVVCSRHDVDRRTGQERTTSVVRLIRQEDFSTSATYALAAGEEAQSIARVESGDSSFFVVGATKIDPDQAEPDEGRLVVLQENADGDVLVASETAIAGCPYAVLALGEGLVATAINSQVAVWSLSPEGELTSSATWSGAFIAYKLACGPEPSTLVVGDAVRSVTLLQYVPPSAAPLQAKLQELGKDYRARYMVAVESLAPFGDATSSAASTQPLQRVLGADADLNLFTLERDPALAARNLAESGTMAPQAQWHIGEVVSRLHRGALSQQLETASAGSGGGGTTGTTAVQPQLIYATAGGAIGVVVEIDAKSGRILSALERNLRTAGEPVGGLDHEALRAFKADKTVVPAAGFVDGTFVERFLDLDESEQERVVRGRSEPERLEVTREEVVALLEEMTRVH